MGKTEAIRKWKIDNRERELQSKRDWAKNLRLTNPEKIKKDKHDSYVRNRDKISKTHKEWRKNNPEKVKQYALKYKKSHSSYIKERGRQYAKLWKQQRPELRKIKRKRSLIKRRNVLSTLTTQEWCATLRKFDNRCTYCKVSGTKLEMEHKLPLSRGGHHTKKNVVPACHKCNQEKGIKTPREWRKRYYKVNL